VVSEECVEPKTANACFPSQPALREVVALKTVPDKQVACRYCGELFMLKAGKPGFIDECPECLNERTAPPPLTRGRKTDNWLDTPIGRKWLKRLTRDLIKMGLPNEIARAKAANLIQDE
jgi:hypothetical protein